MLVLLTCIRGEQTKSVEMCDMKVSTSTWMQYLFETTDELIPLYEK